MRNRTDVCGVGIDSVTMSEAVETAYRAIESREKLYVVTPNPEMLWLSKKNGQLKAALDSAGLVLPDGIGVMIGARILKRPLPEKIPGIDFAERLIERLADTGGSVFLYGSKPGVAELAGKRLTAKYPGLVLAGTCHGYEPDTAKVTDMIRHASPNLLLVCLGVPKQECWCMEHYEDCGAGVCAGLGGALDVFAGVTKRAPRIFRKLQLEWFYRLLREPWRIKRMIKLPLFIFAVIWCRIRGR